MSENSFASFAAEQVYASENRIVKTSISLLALFAFLRIP